MKTKKNESELVNSRTPIYIASIGGVVGSIVIVVAAVTPNISDARFNSMINFATTAISIGFGGAAGIAQQTQANNLIDTIEKVDSIDVEK